MVRAIHGAWCPGAATKRTVHRAKTIVAADTGLAHAPLGSLPPNMSAAMLEGGVLKSRERVAGRGFEQTDAAKRVPSVLVQSRVRPTASTMLKSGVVLGRRAVQHSVAEPNSFLHCGGDSQPGFQTTQQLLAMRAFPHSTREIEMRAACARV